MIIIFGLTFTLILYLVAMGKWLLAIISALGMFTVLVLHEHKQYERAHAAVMKSEHDRAKADRAKRLAEALRELVSTSDGFIEYIDDEDKIGFLPCCGALAYNPHQDDCVVKEARAALRDHDYHQENVDD